jgi:hypothetical protein
MKGRRSSSGSERDDVGRNFKPLYGQVGYGSRVHCVFDQLLIVSDFQHFQFIFAAVHGFFTAAAFAQFLFKVLQLYGSNLAFAVVDVEYHAAAESEINDG